MKLSIHLIDNVVKEIDAMGKIFEKGNEKQIQGNRQEMESR